jgi:hypothetical protein
MYQYIYLNMKVAVSNEMSASSVGGIIFCNGMACPWCVYVGYVLQVCSLTVNMLNNSFGQSTRGCSPAWMLDRGVSPS